MLTRTPPRFGDSEWNNWLSKSSISDPIDLENGQDSEHECNENCRRRRPERVERQSFGAERDPEPTPGEAVSPNNEVLRIQSPLSWSALVTRSMSESNAGGACIGAHSLARQFAPT